MKRSAFISDVIFSMFVAFLLTLLIFRCAKISLTLSMPLSILCGVLTAASFGAYLQSRRRTVFLKKSDEAQKEKLLFHLATLSDEAKTRFFLERLSSETMPAKRFGRLRVYTDTAFYLLCFSIAPVSSDELLRFSRLKTGKEKIVLCAKIEESAYVIAERLGISVRTGEQVYAMLKSQDALPKDYPSGESKDRQRKRRLKLWFSRANAKRFLVAASLLAVSALISPFPYYYFIISALLLATAILVRIFGYE